MSLNFNTSILFSQLSSLGNKTVLLYQNSYQHIHLFQFFFFPLYICKDLCILTSNICAIKSLKTVSSFCFIFSIRSISQLRNSCLSKSPSYEQRKHPYTNSQCIYICFHAMKICATRYFPIHMLTHVQNV